MEEGAAAVGNVRDAQARDVLGGAPRDALAAEAHLALGPDHAAQRAQRGRLPGAVRPEHGDDRALGHFERDAPERLNRPVAGFDPVEAEQHARTAHSSTPRYASITAGSARTSAGAPSAIFSPMSSTQTRLEMSMTTDMSCSISTTVTPRSSFTSRT